MEAKFLLGRFSILVYGRIPGGGGVVISMQRLHIIFVQLKIEYIRILTNALRGGRLG